MQRFKKAIRRFLELATGELMDKLEVAYANSAPEERAVARDRFITEKAKHRVATVTTALVVAVLALVVEKVLPKS